MFVLPVGKIEEYYPTRLRPAIAPNSSGAKKKLAEKVGQQITQAEFETEMKVAFDALSQCWKDAFVAEAVEA